MGESDSGEKKRKKIINDTVVGMAQDSLIQKNGEAASQIIQAYKGVRFDSSGNKEVFYGRNLKKISSYKVDANNPQSSYKQQAGFSAELVKEARDNKEAILNGSRNRTRTTDGLGDTNNTQYDHKVVDGNKNVISGSGSQMKFYGIDAKGRVKVIEEMVNDKSWNRYSVIDIPKDQYQDAIDYADKKANELREKATNLRNKGNLEKAKRLEDKADKYEQSKGRLRKSNVSSDDAMEARVNPEKFVAKEVLKDSHNAGVKASKGAFIISGSISTAQNLYSVFIENKPIDEAVEDVLKTTGSSAVMAYGVGATGTAIKATMHSSNSELVRRIGTTNAPAMITTGIVEVSKSLIKYGKGEIDELKLLQELGEKGTGMVASGFGSAVGASIGSAVGATIGSVIPVVGTMAGGVVGGFIGSFIGSLIGYSSASMLYHGALDALQGAKIAAERRKVIEEISEEAVKQMNHYKIILHEYTRAKHSEREKQYMMLFSELENSITNNDINKYINCMDGFGKAFGVDLKLNSMKEIDEFMNDKDTVFVL